MIPFRCNISFVFLLLLCYNYIPVNAQDQWHKYPGNPIFSYGEKGTWDQSYVYHPQVQYDGEKYYMWYIGGKYREGRDGKIGLATSENGIDWVRYENNPVFSSKDLDAWEASVLDFCLLKQDSLFFMYYAGMRKDLPNAYRIGLATSFDGINWARHPQPIMTESDSGTWDDWVVVELSVQIIDDKYHMWYTGGSCETPSPLGIGYASSKDGIKWNKYPGNPVLEGDPDAWDKQYVFDPIVVYADSVYHMWYAGASYDNAMIGFAISEDGVDWAKDPGNPVFEVDDFGKWDGNWVQNGCMFQSGSHLRLYYGGFGGEGLDYQIGLATTSSAEAIQWDKQKKGNQSQMVKINNLGIWENFDLIQLKNELDSLQGKALVHSYLKLSQYYAQSNRQSSLEWSEKALNLSEKIDYPYGKAIALYCIGSVYYLQNRYQDAFYNFLMAIRILDKLGPSRELGFIRILIGNLHSQSGNHQQALEQYQKALNIYEEIHFKSGLSYALAKTGFSLRANGDTLQAMKILKRRIDLALESSDSLKIASAFSALGDIYRGINLDSAIHFYNKVLLLYRHTINRNTGFIYEEMGIAYMDEGKLYYNQAEKCFLQAVSVFKDWGEGASSKIFIRLGELYLKQKKYEEARSILNKGLEICRDMKKREVNTLTDHPVTRVERQEENNNAIKDVYHYLFILDTLEKKYESAIINHLLEMQWQEKIRNDESKKQFAMLQSKYEEEQYQNKITLLQQENQFRELKYNQTRNFNIGLIGLVAIIILIAILFIRQNKIKTKHQTEVIKHKLLRSQLNPHFIFNSIASIQDFIWKKEASEADQYLTSFAKLMRHVMENSRVDYVPLKKEIETIDNYLKLQHFRFTELFDYHLEVDPEIDEETMAIPPMLAQPFIENSIEHGMKHKNSKGNIHIRISLNGSKIMLHILDDGVGRKLARAIEQKQARDHQSLSTIITRERINMLNKKLKQKIVFKIDDLKNDIDEPTGTSVSFEIPYMIM